MINLTYRSRKTKVGESRIHGRGLFAKERIAKGEIVAVKGGYILNQQKWKEIEPKLGSAEIQITEDLFIAPVRRKKKEESMVYTNHSKENRRIVFQKGPAPDR